MIQRHFRFAWFATLNAFFYYYFFLFYGAYFRPAFFTVLNQLVCLKCIYSSLKGSPGTHSHDADHDPDADDWNSVDSFQREDDVYLLTQQMEKLQNQLSTVIQGRADQDSNVSKLRQDNAGMTER